MSEIDSFLARLIVNCAPHLTCGVDLEYVSNAENEEWLELGDTKISLEIVDIEFLKDYVIGLQTHLGEFTASPDLFKKIALTSKMLVSTVAREISKTKIDVYIASEMIVTGDERNDARSLAAHIDSIYFAKKELAF